MIKAKLILFTLGLAFFAGCESLYFPMYFENTASEPIDIEVLRPADTTISQSIKKVLVFTRPGLVPKIIFLDGRKNLPGILNLDKMPEIELHAMADLLSGSPRFSILEPIHAIKPAMGKFFNADEIDSICTEAGVDACLFLSSEDVYLSLWAASNAYLDSEFSPRGYIWVTSTYEFYSPRDQITITKEVKTGVDFQSQANDDAEIFTSLSDLESLISDYAQENGEKFANWIAPLWQRDTRNYFISGNKELESVKDLIENEKWDEVFKIWRKNTHNEKPAAAKHASFNTIISYEMEGKLDSALYWARETFKRFKSEELVDYGIILEERIRENELVSRQLGLSEGN